MRFRGELPFVDVEFPTLGAIEAHGDAGEFIAGNRRCRLCLAFGERLGGELYSTSDVRYFLDVTSFDQPINTFVPAVVYTLCGVFVDFFGGRRDAVFRDVLFDEAEYVRAPLSDVWELRVSFLESLLDGPIYEPFPDKNSNVLAGIRVQVSFYFMVFRFFSALFRALLLPSAVEIGLFHREFRKFFVAWVRHFRSFLLFSKKMSSEIKFTERTFSIARFLISAQ